MAQNNGNGKNRGPSREETVDMGGDDERLGRPGDDVVLVEEGRPADSGAQPRKNPFLNSRTDRDEDEDRGDRALLESRVMTEDRVLTDEERAEAFRMGLYQAILPDVPPIPGYHVFWHTTLNPKDSVERRLMLGYEYVTLKDCPGFKAPTLKDGLHEGCIGIREMIAMKLPLRLYYKYMSIAHHEEPNRLAEAIVAKIDEHSDELRDRGSKLLEGDGMKSIREETHRRAKFTRDAGDLRS